MHRPERTWQSASAKQKVVAGTNSFELAGLKSGTRYFYRLFVEHDEGKSWDCVSGGFETAKQAAGCRDGHARRDEHGQSKARDYCIATKWT